MTCYDNLLAGVISVMPLAGTSDENCLCVFISLEVLCSLNAYLCEVCLTVAMH